MNERETAPGLSAGPTCEFVDFSGDSREECGDPGKTYRIKNNRLDLCEPHLEAVLRQEGLHPDPRGKAAGGSAA